MEYDACATNLKPRAKLPVRFCTMLKSMFLQALLG